MIGLAGTFWSNLHMPVRAALPYAISTHSTHDGVVVVCTWLGVAVVVMCGVAGMRGWCAWVVRYDVGWGEWLVAGICVGMVLLLCVRCCVERGYRVWYVSLCLCVMCVCACCVGDVEWGEWVVVGESAVGISALVASRSRGGLTGYGYLCGCCHC